MPTVTYEIITDFIIEGIGRISVFTLWYREAKVEGEHGTRIATCRVFLSKSNFACVSETLQCGFQEGHSRDRVHTD